MQASYPSLAFDLYGTLIDHFGIEAEVSKATTPEDAPAIVGLWRQKQLEYSFRRGLMLDYTDFGRVTADALSFALDTFGYASEQAIETLMEAYGRLPLFEGAAGLLQDLRGRGASLWICSNGSRPAIEGLLRRHRLEPYFDGVISAGDIKMFKPHPGLYALAQRQMGLDRTNWMVSSNAFDVIGAASAGMRSIWIERPGNRMDSWGPKPTITCPGLASLPELLAPW